MRRTPANTSLHFRHLKTLKQPLAGPLINCTTFTDLDSTIRHREVACADRDLTPVTRMVKHVTEDILVSVHDRKMAYAIVKNEES